MGARRLIAVMCLAEVLTMVSVFAFPALLPAFISDWRLSNTNAGWIAGIYFAGYAAASVLLVLTDRVDARLIYVGGALTAALSALAFALFARGFWMALALRFIAGVGLAATYMPGLRVLIDRYRGDRPSRAVALYTSSFSLGTAVSYFLAGVIADLAGWPWAFGAAALGAFAAAVVVLLLPAHRPEAPPEGGRLLDFRPVFGERTVMGYVLAYAVHCWELFTWRSWMVAFLAFSLVLHPDPMGSVLSPTMVATISGLVAWAASIGGNELCVRYGRRRVIGMVMACSAAMAAGIGFAAPLPYLVVVVLALVYSAAVQLDSGALTAGAVAAARPGRRGATMAVHAVLGFAAAGIGPIVLGRLLDLSGGGESATSWGLAFASVAAVGVLGPLALRLVAPEARRT
jgi:MFS family permease